MDSAFPKSSYFVLNGHTLGFTNPLDPGHFQVLHGSVLKGGHDWKNGPVPLTDRDTLVPATLADFKEYRVRPEGHIV